MKKVAKKSTEKYITEKNFEKHMGGIARSFTRIEESLEMIVRELKNLHEDNK